MVFITNGVYTFLKYNYPEDGINWVYPGMYFLFYLC